VGLFTFLGPALLGMAPLPWKLAAVPFAFLPAFVLLRRAKSPGASGPIASATVEDQRTPHWRLRVLLSAYAGLATMAAALSLGVASGATFALLLAVGLAGVLVVARLLARSATVHAGSDGVLLASGRFVPYANIAKVVEELDYVVLVTKSGKRIDIEFAPPGDALELPEIRAERSALVARIESQLGAAANRRVRVAAELVDAAISDPPHAETRLRALAERHGYRVATLEAGALEELALAEDEPLERRRAAIFALSQRDPTEARRIAARAAEAVIDDGERSALERAGAGLFGTARAKRRP
jgi:hypothetical protein